jgi:4-hydroxybenzoate polyprenyltransferase
MFPGMIQGQRDNGEVADAMPLNWVDRLAPQSFKPYMRLARLDRPIGTWLLLWPCWWSLALAALYRGTQFPSLWLIVLFGIGAIVMRGAGCTYNDLVDKDLDGRVERTRSRPIPSGQVSVGQAKSFMIAQALVGLGVLLQFNWFAIWLGAASLLIIAIYPFMKRITYFPQIVLGLAFNWGALLGWAAVTGELHPAAYVLYLAGIGWTLAYDTIYAHQDKEDDALVGIKSTALRFGKTTRYWLVLFFMITVFGIGLAGILAGAGKVFLVVLGLAAFHAIWQLKRLDIDDPDTCLMLFRSNREFGWLVFAAILTDIVVAKLS